MDVQDFLPRILAAGFALEPDGADIIVRPFSKLSEPQKAFIRQYKPALIAALTGKPPAQPAATQTYQATPADLATVADWLARIGESPEGTAATLDRCRADPEALAYFLALATRPATAQEAVRNPEPLPTSAPGLDRALQATVGGQGVHCRDCGHAQATQHPALIVCGAGCRAPGACGMWWNLDRHNCPSFIAADLASTSTKGAA